MKRHATSYTCDVLRDDFTAVKATACNQLRYLASHVHTAARASRRLCLCPRFANHSLCASHKKTRTLRKQDCRKGGRACARERMHAGVRLIARTFISPSPSLYIFRIMSIMPALGSELLATDAAAAAQVFTQHDKRLRVKMGGILIDSGPKYTAVARLSLFHTSFFWVLFQFPP